MKKIGLLFSAVVMCVSFQVQANDKLDAFAQDIIHVFASGDMKQYMGILHPDCPAPNPDRLAWQMSKTWLADKVDIRFKDVAESYDRKKLDFAVEPESVIGFQVWTIDSDGEKSELVTSYPIATYKTGFKILDYPCFKPK
ncbi:MAG: hypothetical protein COB36_05660 [Alphaproteobacteria bacterium]|nr:MAG: hypothetical protein COB36_05660 [Alphaproteobacteria bacterium]